MDAVLRARDPDRASGIQGAFDAAQPRPRELEVCAQAAGFVPLPLVDRDPLTTLAGGTIVAKKIRRIGEHHVKTAIGILSGDGIEQVRSEERRVGKE